MAAEVTKLQMGRLGAYERALQKDGKGLGIAPGIQGGQRNFVHDQTPGVEWMAEAEVGNTGFMADPFRTGSISPRPEYLSASARMESIVMFITRFRLRLAR